MRGKKLLAAFLLAAGLCFVPALGYGELRVPHGGEITADLELYKEEPLYPLISRMNGEIGRLKMAIELLRSKIDYIMNNSAVPLYVDFNWDADGDIRGSEFLPDDVDTKGKVLVWLMDYSGRFSGKSGIDLLDEFKRALEMIYVFIEPEVTDMDADVVAEFFSKQSIPLGYFYQGEYHLWEK